MHRRAPIRAGTDATVSPYSLSPYSPESTLEIYVATAATLAMVPV